MRRSHVSIIRIGELGGWLLPLPLPLPQPRAATKKKKTTGRRRAPENHSPSPSSPMAASAATLAFTAPSAPVEGRNLSTRPLLPASHRVILPSLRSSYCRRAARHVIAMASDESLTRTRIEDKYAITILAFSGVVALWVSTGMVSAIDRLPVLPGVLELVGIGYTGWFVYQNLVFKPDREALLEKIKGAYNDITGSK
ncbi:unnamed protein product [Spirodela intermedia]|uniref:Cyanobacterial aminoacyl-tRNA synthetase CAAD domain-containing protein n=1 Tax=Spirodela intermedia TaxID=51605 RepID=A0A7I8JNX5_SPIIN|nr:unnamed protein product [Spirodela intermedia]CAA6671856.1 unnamed protein product [Spirodela intermedia]